MQHRLPAIVLAGVIGVLVALCAPRAAAAATGCSLSEMSSSSQPACWKPFNASSPFNTQLPSSPTLASNSGAEINRMVSSGWSLDGSNSSFSLSPAAYGTRPVFFATPSDPTLRIHCTYAAGSGSCTGQGSHVNVNGARIHAPAGARPYANSDGHFTVIETATGAEYDFWDTSLSGSTLNAGVAGVVNVNSGNGLGSQGDAAAFGLTGGLLRPSELASGNIGHSLVVTVPCVNGTGSAAWTWPAQGPYGSECGGSGNANAPALGQLLRLNMSDGQIQGSSAPGWEKTIMTALAHYGAYVEDVDGNQATGLDILSQAGASWTDIGKSNQWNQFGSLSSSTPIPIGNFQVVAPCVPRGTCSGAPSGASPGPPSAGSGATKHRKHHRHKRHHAKKHHHHKHHRKHHHKHKRHHHKRHHKHR